jgi:hypothetical protein
LGEGEYEMEAMKAQEYKEALDALPPERQSERLWEEPRFKAKISYGPAPRREMILEFPDGSVFDYRDRLAYSQDDWADRNEFTVWPATSWRWSRATEPFSELCNSTEQKFLRT